MITTVCYRGKEEPAIHHIQTEEITPGAHEESSPSPLEELSPSPLEESYTHGDLTNGDHVKPISSLDISLQVCSPWQNISFW